MSDTATLQVMEYHENSKHHLFRWEGMDSGT